MDWKVIIQEIIQLTGMNLTEMHKKTGLSITYLYRLKSGSIKEPTFDKAMIILGQHPNKEKYLTWWWVIKMKATQITAVFFIAQTIIISNDRSLWMLICWGISFLCFVYNAWSDGKWKQMSLLKSLVLMKLNFI